MQKAVCSHVVLKPFKQGEAKSAYGLYTPTKDQPSLGEVVSIGQMVDKREVAEGDVVSFNMRKQVRWSWDGEEFIGIPIEDIVAVMR